MTQAGAASVVDAIRDGTFPDSDEVLSSDLTSSTVSELLSTISKTKEDLDQDIRGISHSLVGGVDDWIAQAKKVQQDIEQCKIEAKRIVEEHARVEARHSEAAEALRKSQLLQNEIDFTQSLQGELHTIAEVSQALRSIEQLLSNGAPAEAAARLTAVRPKTGMIKGPNVQSIVLEYHDDLERQTRDLLEQDLNTTITLSRDKNALSLNIERSHDSASSTADTIHGLKALNALDDGAKTITTKLEAFAIQALRTGSQSRLSSHSIENNRFDIHFDDSEPSMSEVITFVQDFIQYMHTYLPQELLATTTPICLPKIISTLITDWLNPAIPAEMSRLDELGTLRTFASSLAESIDSYDWQGATQLAQWLEQAPRMWLAKRKAETLDSVRHTFMLSKSEMHQVERVERQKASILDKFSPTDKTTDDWNTSWDDEQHKNQDTPSGNEEDADDTSGWGFEDDEEDHTSRNRDQKPNGAEHNQNEDTGDAWGWEDENDDEQQGQKHSKNYSNKSNGQHDTVKDSQEIVLTELYTVSDIPDRLLEAIDRDISDAMSIQEHNHSSLSDIPAASGLLALPTLALAMFRATATTHYTNAHNLGNMNLYNDAMYIADKLRDMNAPTGMQTNEADSAAMTKFARSAYAREMDTQRTILSDLLDGAQGFSNCTQFPYSQEIENAVTSTVDRLRAVHAEWQPILSTSALLQSTGSLLSTIIAKFINDVEELEDISEAQSSRLAGFTAQITALEDLFLASPPGAGGEAAKDEAVPMTAVYVNNWLKFQYLAQILESSLVDIKYLWTEGELSLEFEAEEVVDLVKALFAESGHRRAAVAAIKAGR